MMLAGAAGTTAGASVAGEQPIAGASAGTTAGTGAGIGAGAGGVVAPTPDAGPDVMPDGSMENCAIVSVAGSAATTYQPGTTACPPGIQFTVPTESAGKLHSKHVTMTVETKVSDAD